MFCFKVQDCHVIKYLPKEEYDGHTAALVVGGKNASPFYVRIPHDLKKKEQKQKKPKQFRL